MTKNLGQKVKKNSSATLGAGLRTISIVIFCMKQSVFSDNKVRHIRNLTKLEDSRKSGERIVCYDFFSQMARKLREVQNDYFANRTAKKILRL